MDEITPKNNSQKNKQNTMGSHRMEGMGQMDDMNQTKKTGNMGGGMDNMNQVGHSNKMKKMMIWTIIFILIALAAGGVVGYFIGKMDKDQAVENARNQAKQEAMSQHEQKDSNGSSSQTTTPEKTTTDATCNADELSLTMGEGSGAAGTVFYPLIFTNTGDRTCNLYGYPGVSLVDNNGNMIGEPAERTPSTEATITLEPGGKTQANMGVPNSSNFPEGQCKDGATKIRVYPPNDTGYLSIASGADITSWCPGFSISPVANVD